MKRIKSKKIAFVACEGGSETGYVKILNSYIEQKYLDISIKEEYLKGGSRFVMANKAIKKLKLFKQRINKDKRIYIKAIFLDTDNADKEEISKITDLLEKQGFIVIWQKPDYEAFLWRHFKGKNRIPPDPGKVEEDLKRFLPNYKKNYSAENLKKKIDLPMIINVAHSLKNEGYDGLFILLEKMGLLEG